MAYHQFKDEDGESFGSFEVFYLNEREAQEQTGGACGAGWYWWACFPGCMPDGEAMGPFNTEKEAIENANDN